MVVSIIVFLIILSILILVHEAGHYFAAKRAGVWVEEFGIGYPPRVYGRKIGETIYSVNLLPIGGFVRLHGENVEEGISKSDRAFLNKDKKTRAWIIVAGVVMNILLGILAFAIVYSFSGIPVETEHISIVELTPTSPARDVDIVIGDQILRVNGEDVKSTTKFAQTTRGHEGEKVILTIQREVEKEVVTKDVTVTLRSEYPQDEGPLGASVTSTEIYYPPIWQRPFIGAYYGLKEAIFWGQAIVMGIFGMIARLFVGEIPKEVAGPVGIFALTSEATKFGVLAVINFVGILSINLAILNILPFPALDGGRLLFIVIESLFGRKVLPKVEASIHLAGMIVLILLVIAITISDVRRLVDNGGVSGFIDSFVQ